MTEKPVELKKLHGTYNATRDDGKKPMAEVYPGGQLSKIEQAKEIEHPSARKEWEIVIKRLISLKVIFPEDIPTLKTHFVTLSEAYKTFDQIKKTRREIKKLEREKRAAENKDERDWALIKIFMDQISWNEDYILRLQTLWIKLTNQYQTIAKDYLATPLQKTKIIGLLAKEKEPDNPILAVLEDD